MIELRINGRTHSVDPEPERSLLRVLREELDLTGAKYACGEGACGACMVLVDGAAVPACRQSLRELAGREVITIEGLGTAAALHPVQRAFLEVGALQCGFCTPGMIASAVALLSSNPSPSDAEIVAAMDRNLCRCGVYPRIIEAVRRAAVTMRGTR